MIVLKYFFVFVISTCSAANVAFIEEPHNQSILIGENATFSCKAYAHSVTWYINDEDLEWPYDWDDPPVDIHLGEEMFTSDTYNLTMIIDGTNFRNNTKIHCVAIGIDSTRVTSTAAFLRVYELLPLNVTFSTSEWPTFLVLYLQESSYWPDQNASHYDLTVQIDTTTAALYRGEIPTTVPSIRIPMDLFENCTQYILTTTIVSPFFGSSNPHSFVFASPYVALPSITYTNIDRGIVYFDKNFEPFLHLQTEVSNICSFIDYQYFITVAPVNQSLSSPLRLDPREITESGLMEEMIPGLESNTQYTVQVEVNYSILAIIQKSVVSDALIFNTSFDQDFICGETEGPQQVIPNTSTATDNYALLALAIFCAILGLTLAAFIIACICIIWRRKSVRKRGSRPTSEPMVPNPIYSGPLYETVPQGYNPLCSSTSTTPDSSPTTPLNACGIHYTPSPTSRTDILDLVRQTPNPAQQSNERIPSPLTRTSYRSSSVSSNSTIKKPQRERNKLHLTLSLGMGENGADDQIGSIKERTTETFMLSDDSNYTIMSPVVSRKSDTSFSGGWAPAESSPENTSKYQE